MLSFSGTEFLWLPPRGSKGRKRKQALFLLTEFFRASPVLVFLCAPTPGYVYEALPKFHAELLPYGSPQMGIGDFLEHVSMQHYNNGLIFLPRIPVFFSVFLFVCLLLGGLFTRLFVLYWLGLLVGPVGCWESQNWYDQLVIFHGVNFLCLISMKENISPFLGTLAVIRKEERPLPWGQEWWWQLDRDGLRKTLRFWGARMEKSSSFMTLVLSVK